MELRPQLIAVNNKYFKIVFFTAPRLRHLLFTVSPRFRTYFFIVTPRFREKTSRGLPIKFFIV